MRLVPRRSPVSAALAVLTAAAVVLSGRASTAQSSALQPSTVPVPAAFQGGTISTSGSCGRPARVSGLFSYAGAVLAERSEAGRSRDDGSFELDVPVAVGPGEYTYGFGCDYDDGSRDALLSENIVVLADTLPGRDGELAVSPKVVDPGGEVRVTGRPFAEYHLFAVAMYTPTRRILATGRVHESESVDANVTIPSDISGSHEIVVAAHVGDGSGSVRYYAGTVTAGTPPTSISTSTSTSTTPSPTASVPNTTTPTAKPTTTTVPPPTSSSSTTSPTAPAEEDVTMQIRLENDDDGTPAGAVAAGAVSAFAAWVMLVRYRVALLRGAPRAGAADGSADGRQV